MAAGSVGTGFISLTSTTKSPDFTNSLALSSLGVCSTRREYKVCVQGACTRCVCKRGLGRVRNNLDRSRAFGENPREGGEIRGNYTCMSWDCMSWDRMSWDGMHVKRLHAKTHDHPPQNSPRTETCAAHFPLGHPKSPCERESPPTASSSAASPLVCL